MCLDNMIAFHMCDCYLYKKWWTQITWILGPDNYQEHSFMDRQLDIYPQSDERCVIDKNGRYLNTSGCTLVFVENNIAVKSDTFEEINYSSNTATEDVKHSFLIYNIGVNCPDFHLSLSAQSVTKIDSQHQDRFLILWIDMQDKTLTWK